MKIRRQANKYKYFKGSRSEALQDSFVLNVLAGKKKGYYLEIGSGHPFIGNNTILLENSFDWQGISIDYDPNSVDLFNQSRKNTCVLADATKFDYRGCLKLHNFPHTIDYLQLDIDPAANTLIALKQIPFDEYKFVAITFEHDLYLNSENLAVKTEATEILTKFGYVRVVNDVMVIPNVVGHNGGRWAPFEDWWIHKDFLGIPQQVFNEQPFTSIFEIPPTLKINLFLHRFKLRIRLLKNFPLKKLRELVKFLVK